MIPLSFGGAQSPTNATLMRERWTPAPYVKGRIEGPTAAWGIVPERQQGAGWGEPLGTPGQNPAGLWTEHSRPHRVRHLLELHGEVSGLGIMCVHHVCIV